MSGSTNTFFAAVNGTADAVGSLTTTNVATQTVAAPGVAFGFAAAVSAAQDTAPAAPYTTASTSGFVSGGSITTSHTGHMSIDFPYGPTPVFSADASVTFIATYGGGNFPSDYSLSGLASPSLHGLL
jgi:hypothetical protein